MSENDLSSDVSVYEPLSKRELEILALLAENLPDREIANRLIIAHTTVKWYNRQIFNKLGVENRREAIKAAKLLGLVGQGETDNQPKHTLIAPSTPLVGRQREIAQVAQLLDEQQSRLVTILAPGGMGKTRLALAVAALPRFNDIVCFVPLAPLTSPEHMVSTIAERLGFQFGADERTLQQQLLDSLRRKTLLLVLDNLEHLLEGAALVSDIVQTAPKVSVLVTSRERLNLSGETVYLLEGLPFPPPYHQNDVLKYDAAQLFVQSARRAQAQFSLTETANVARVCQLVQGMPLAIDLAAAWAGSLSASEIADEIGRSLDFLQTDQRDMPERLRSIRAVFESSWRRLSEDEQIVFRRLSVFRGGCTREAAQTVTGASLKTLTGLLYKALIRRNPESNRYEIHELLRQYARQELEVADDAAATEKAHTEYFAARAGEWGKELTDGNNRQLVALQAIENDFENIRSALKQATEQADTRLIEAFTNIWLFYEIRGLWHEGQAVYGAAIEQLQHEDSITLGRLLARRAFYLDRIGLYEESLACANRSLTLFQQHQAEQETFLTLFIIGGSLSYTDISKAQAVWSEMSRLAHLFNDQWAIMFSDWSLSLLASIDKKPELAKELLVQSYQMAKARGDLWATGSILRDLGVTTTEIGDYEAAKQTLEEGLQSAQLIHQPLMVAGCLCGLSYVAREQGNFAEAKPLMEKSVQIIRDTGASNILAIHIAILGDCEAKLGNYSDSKKYLHEALQIVHHSPRLGEVLFVLIHVAALKAQSGATTRALEFISLITHHSLYNTLDPNNHVAVERLRTKMERVLLPHTYQAAWERGKGLQLEQVVDDFLAEA